MIELAPAHLVAIKADLAKSTVRLTFDIMFTPDVLRAQKELADFANGDVSLYLTLERNSVQLSLFSASPATFHGLPKREETRDDPAMQILPQRTAVPDDTDEGADE